MLEQLLGKDEIEMGVRKRKLIMREPDSMKPVDVAALRLFTLFPVQSEICVPQLKNIDSISVIAKVQQRADIVAQATTHIQDPASCRERMACLRGKLQRRNQPLSQNFRSSRAGLFELVQKECHLLLQSERVLHSCSF